MNNRKLFYYIFNILRQNIRKQIIGFIFMILYSIILLLSPYTSGYLIDRIVSAINISDIIVGIFIFCSSIILQPFIGILKDMMYMDIVLNFNRYNYLDMFRKLVYAPMDFFCEIKKGEIISKCTNDIQQISEFISDLFVILIKDIILSTFILGAMFFISEKITVIIVILLVILFVINEKLMKNIEELSNENLKKNDQIYSKITQVISSIEMIKVLGCEEKIIDEYSCLLNEMYLVSKQREKIRIIANHSIELIIMISLSLIYLVGCIDVLNGKITVGNLISLGLYYQLIMEPLFEIIRYSININNIKPIISRFYEMKNIKEEKYTKNNKMIIKTNRQDINIVDLYYRYKERYILEGIKLHTPNKGCIGIMGNSGQGKSTILKLIIGLYNAEKGNIYIGGINIKDIGLKELRKNISFVSQEIILFNKSIIENFYYVNDRLSYEEIIELCKKTNLHETIINMDNQYETVMGEFLNLSGGERQRMGIAMALAKKTSIILMDEPTSALDTYNTKIVIELIKKLSVEKLLIIISHDEDILIQCASKIYILKNGKIIDRENSS